MARLFRLSTILLALILSGCTAEGVLTSLFGAPDSNRADLVKLSPKNADLGMGASITP